jgi:hypothetical protein
MTEECAFGAVGDGLGSAKAGVTGARAARKDRAAESAAVPPNPMQTNSLRDGFLMGSSLDDLKFHCNNWR